MLLYSFMYICQDGCFFSLLRYSFEFPQLCSYALSLRSSRIPPLLCQPDSLCYNGGKGTSGAGYGLRGTAGGIEDVENAEIGV
ncbi:hypothetical protein F220043C3_32110 [Enterocloster asparagiformis]